MLSVRELFFVHFQDAPCMCRKISDQTNLRLFTNKVFRFKKLRYAIELRGCVLLFSFSRFEEVFRRLLASNNKIIHWEFFCA